MQQQQWRHGGNQTYLEQLLLGEKTDASILFFEITIQKDLIQQNELRTIPLLFFANKIDLLEVKLEELFKILDLDEELTMPVKYQLDFCQRTGKVYQKDYNFYQIQQKNDDP
ncbi:hypothetical protein pb186bvf_004542 [Paramecium bursaria]